MFKRCGRIVVLLVLACAGGCNWLEFPAYVLFAQSKRKVKAEYAHLADTKTALIIVTDPSTDFEFPEARLNIAFLVTNSIAANVDRIRFAAQHEVDTFQREDLGWFDLPMAEIGKRFDADRLLYLDVIRFTLTEDNSVGLLRGRLIADVRVYDMESMRPNLPCYQTEIEVVCPEHSPLPMNDMARQSIHRQTLLLFSEQLARKFYDHKVLAVE